MRECDYIISNHLVKYLKLLTGKTDEVMWVNVFITKFKYLQKI